MHTFVQQFDRKLWPKTNVRTLQKLCLFWVIIKLDSRKKYNLDYLKNELHNYAFLVTIVDERILM